MSLQVYNYLTRQKEPFEPLVAGHVGMYVCGPTVYDHAHLGHAKLYVAMDTVVRYLRYTGYRVRYVQNITDVGHLLDTGEDRILKGVRRERVEPMELVETYTRSYFESMDALREAIRNDFEIQRSRVKAIQLEAFSRHMQAVLNGSPDQSLEDQIRIWEEDDLPMLPGVKDTLKSTTPVLLR